MPGYWLFDEEFKRHHPELGRLTRDSHRKIISDEELLDVIRQATSGEEVPITEASEDSSTPG